MRGLRVIFTAVCAVLLSCTQPGTPRTQTPPALRIVSLSPAMTRTVVDLGGAHALVGRTPWCRGVDAPVVGTLHDQDLGRMAEACPTVILVQAAAPDPALVAFASERGAEVVGVHIDRLRDIDAMLDRVAEVLTAGGIPQAAQARTDIARRSADERALARPAVEAAGATLLLFGADPPMAFGTGTYIGDLWEALGGVNALQRSGYPELSLEDIVRLDPARIILVRGTPGGVPTTLQALPAAVRARVHAVHAPVLLEPGSGFLLEGAAALAAGARP